MSCCRRRFCRAANGKIKTFQNILCTDLASALKSRLVPFRFCSAFLDSSSCLVGAQCVQLKRASPLRCSSFANQRPAKLSVDSHCSAVHSTEQSVFRAVSLPSSIQYFVLEILISDSECVLRWGKLVDWRESPFQFNTYMEL